MCFMKHQGNFYAHLLDCTDISLKTLQHYSNICYSRKPVIGEETSSHPQFMMASFAAVFRSQQRDMVCLKLGAVCGLVEFIKSPLFPLPFYLSTKGQVGGLFRTS